MRHNNLVFFQPSINLSGKQEEIMKKKLLVLLVTAALALVALPMAAFADDSVAAIDDKKYPTLQAAVNDAPDNTQTTITLLGDASGDGVIVPSSKIITFDLASFTYTVSGKTVGSSGTEIHQQHLQSADSELL